MLSISAKVPKIGYPVGFVGLDIVLSIANAMYEEFKDPQYVPLILLRKMVAAGWDVRRERDSTNINKVYVSIPKEVERVYKET